MAGTFECSVVTPEAPVVEAEEVRHAAFPAWDGQVGVLHNHAPLLAKLGSGPLRLDLPGGDSRVYFVSGGFAQVKDNRLTVLTDEATPADEINRDAAEAALREAQALRGEDREAAERKQKDLQRARGMLSLAARQ